MLTLTLIRHAKSSWENAELSDFDRPLNKRGHRDARLMTRVLSKLDYKPDLILTSPSKRTLATLHYFKKARVVSGEGAIPLDSIYESSHDGLLTVIASQSNNLNSIALIGHNPGLTELTEVLSGIDIGNLPTCGVVKLTTDSNRWSDIRDSYFKLSLLLTPKGIQNG